MISIAHMLDSHQLPQTIKFSFR